MPPPLDESDTHTADPGAPACAVCAKPVPRQALAAARSRRHPHGGYTADGRPLCYDHRLTRCEKCGELHARAELITRTLSWRKDTHLRGGMKPRVEAITGSLCAQCNRTHEDPSAPGDYGFAMVVLGVILFGGVAVYLWLHLLHHTTP